MKYTTLMMEKIEALRMARRLIANEKESYICIALNEVKIQRPEYKDACNSLQSYIRDAFGGAGIVTTLYRWQLKNGFHPYDSENGKIRKDRLDWIDWMIACLEDPK